MNEKSAQVLELPKILERLARFSDFSAGAELIRDLKPTTDPREAVAWQKETSEARSLLEAKSDITLGGARELRPYVEQALRGIVLEAPALLDIRSTLRRATTIKRTLARLRGQFPILADVADGLEECSGLQGEISRVLDDNGKILDSASPRLAVIRRDMNIAFERLQSRLSNLINNANNAKFLQEQLITQRNGRYVIPLRSEFKGRIPGIVHDQSSSGATLFIEPLATVELNNTVRELELEEENEIRRILRALSDLVAHEANYLVRTVEGLAHLDLAFAKARYASQIRATAPRLTGFTPNGDAPGSVISITGARHPLLEPRTVVPIDLTMNEGTYALIITGPNTGGKTVALKTVGLLAMMAQCGLHIPAEEGAELSVFEGIYADIGDEQSIEQSLSTFSAHMTNTINILKDANNRSLVLLDELGAGTDPAEGAALARAILNHLLDHGVTTIVTTHHPELKVYSQSRPGARNASVEFDLETLRPTYRLVVGIPGRSNALAIATRLGLPVEIIEDARSMVGTEDLIADNLLDELSRTREETRKARDAAVQAQNQVESMKKDLRQRLDDLEIERRDLVAQTRRTAERELDSLRQEIRRMRQDLQTASQPLDVIKKLEARAHDLKPSTIQTPEQETAPMLDDEPAKYKLGDRVWVSALKSEGEITELSSYDAEVAVGRLRVRVKLDDLDRRAPADADNVPQSAGARRKKREEAATPTPDYDRPIMKVQSPGLELDLRGARIEEALEKVDGYIDTAYLSGLPFVRIIHGKGTGALRKAIRDKLHGHPLIQKYGAGDDKEGGDGVTVITFVPHR
jgi:DNA mismatch repair protein MutS2